MSSLTFLLVTDFLHLWIWSLSRQFFMKSVIFHDKHWFNYLILLSCFILVEITHMLKLYFKQSLKKLNIWFSSVQFNHSFMSYSLRSHESQHDRPPCPSPTPRVYSNTCPLSQWCYPAISSSVIPFSSCPQSLPASESFPMSQFFAWGDQSTGASALASFLPKKSQGWSSEWTG